MREEGCAGLKNKAAGRDDGTGRSVLQSCSETGDGEKGEDTVLTGRERTWRGAIRMAVEVPVVFDGEL